ncbi:hypothetical protein J4429_02570 [Candidatus Pacearchaeota archaeon]|nr:hypothetical protein [Candidatus Pacearchaeota archaeon]
MRLFDFLKSKKTETKPIIDVQLKDLERTIKEKKKELSIKEEEILNQVKNKTKLLIKDLEEKSIKLENIDLNQKKTEERVKLIVKENLFYFLSNLKKLINNINNLETNELSKFIEELNKKFFDFEKKSLINYEKATFLIGKELGDVKDSISNFFKNLNGDLNENKELFDNLKTINICEEKLKKIKELDSRKNEIKNNIKNIEIEILELTKENELFEKSIDKIKKSDSYKNEIDNEILIHEKNQQYEKELLKLRELVNFKALTNVFHSNEKIMNKINNYKNYFKDAFESDSQTIVHLLKEAKIEDNIISKKINELKKHKEILLNLKEDKKENEIKHVLDIQSNIKNNNSEIENLNNEKIKEDKLIQKFEENHKEIADELKQELMKMNFKLIDD